MTCDVKKDANGVTAILCSRGSHRALCECCGKRMHTKLCDFKLAGAMVGKTCDRKMCDSCATNVGRNRDYCPAHATKNVTP